MKRLAIARDVKMPNVLPGQAWNAIFSLWLLSTGCSHEDELEVLGEGRFVQLRAADGVELCGGTIAAIDEFVEASYLYLEEVPPDRRFITYHWLPGQSPCPESDPEKTVNCTQYHGNESAIYSIQPFHRHELVHAVHNEALGDAPTFLHEGLAQTLSQPSSDLLGWPENVVLDGFLMDDRSSSNFNSASWHLVYWILELHGVSAFKEFWTLVGEYNDPGVGDLRNAFEEAFGQTIDVQLEQVAEQAACAIPMCTGVVVEWMGDTWSTDGPSTCSEPSTIGALQRGEERLLLKEEILEVPEDGRYSVTLSGAETSEAAELRRCDTTCYGDADAVIATPATEGFEAMLQAGRYRVTTSNRPGTAPPTLAVTQVVD